MKPLQTLATLATLSCLALKCHAVDVEMLRFAGVKETQARELAKAQTNRVPSFLWSFFDAVRVDDWETATNLAARLDRASGRFGGQGKEPEFPALRTELWQSFAETRGAYEMFHDWNHKWLRRFASNVIDSIPPGSIYFGGTDPGRFVISALSESHLEGRPFFTLTQNQLVDGTYLSYLQKMYGGKLRIPNEEDLRLAFEQYTLDAAQRLKTGRLKPGENVRMGENGRVSASGQVAVMEMNALLARIIVDRNSGRECYVEESFPLDWMYPQLSPHGLILKLHPKPLTDLSPDMVEKDQNYWKQLSGELIGDWIRENTSVRELCEFTEKVYLRKDLDGFKGDRGFAENREAQATFAKLRSAIAGVYVWRASHARDEDGKNRMMKAADLAYRQAFAYCPRSPEVVFRYCQLLVVLKRPDDAQLIAHTGLRMDPDSAAFQDLVRTLRRVN